MKRVTIQDIAEAMGLSRNTVSKAINNADGLAEATREKILKKAMEMGYRQFPYFSEVPGAPDPLPAPASADVTRVGEEISLFTTCIFNKANHFAASMLDRLRQELAQYGYVIGVHLVSPEDLAGKLLPVTFQKERSRGILCFELFDWDYGEMVCSMGIPVLFVDGPHKRSGMSLPCDQLYMENSAGITRLVNTMVQKGVRKIGFIGDYEHCQSFYERYTAFRIAMQMAGVPVDESHVIKVLGLPPIQQQLCALRDLPELFICCNDFAAVDALQTLRGLGVSVPDEVQLCGFGDAPESRIVTPTLTTVHIHSQVMAFSAMQLLMARIQEPTPALDYRIIHTETELIWRGSTRT